MNIAAVQGIDGLTIMKKLKTNAIFSGNRDLAEKIEEAIIQANGNDVYISELSKIHEPTRRNVNRVLVKSLGELDESIRTPQFNFIFSQLKIDTLN